MRKNNMHGGKNGKKGRGYNAFNYEELSKFQEKLEHLAEEEHEEIMNMAIKRVAARFLREVVKLTPVGEYNDGRVGGTLRRGWTANSQRLAELNTVFGVGNTFSEALKSIRVEKHGDYYYIMISNTVEYASYVNYGHRTRGGKGWVEGKFFVEIAHEKVNGKKSKDIEMVVLKYLKEALE